MNILLVEDNPKDAGRVLDYIGAFNGKVTVRSATTLAAAVREIMGRDVDVVLLDLDLADSHSIQTVEAIRSITDAAIVVLSCCEDEVECVSCLSFGADDYLMKSELSKLSLESVVDGAMRRKSIRRVKSRINYGMTELMKMWG